MGITVFKPLQPHQPNITIAEVSSLLRRYFTNLRAEFDIFPDRPPGKQKIFLKHDGPLRVRTVHQFPVYINTAARKLLKAGQKKKKRRFSASAGSDNGNELIPRYLNAQRIERGDLFSGGKNLSNLFGLNKRHCVFPPLSAR